MTAIKRVSRVMASALMLMAAPAFALETVAPPRALPAFAYREESGAERPFSADSPLTILHFWATWCVPCVAELPQLDAFAAANPRMRVLALSLDGDAKKVREFYAANGIRNLPVLLDRGNAAFRAARAGGIPASVFVNAKGEVVARADGAVEWGEKTLKKRVDEITSAAPASPSPAARPGG